MAATRSGSVGTERSRGRDRTTDLGTRPLGALLWFACSQTTMSVGIYGIYALTNAWFVSWGVGPVAFAAVNLVTPVFLALGAVGTTVGVGGASLVSRYLGRGDLEGAARAAGSAFALYWAAALLVAALGLVFLDPLLTALGAAGDVREYARDYALILLAGSITATGFSALVRAEGRMGFSTLLWVLPVLTQIVLDPILILGFDMGVSGAALGTLGGQTVSMGLSIWFFFVQRERPYRISLRHLAPRPSLLGAVVSVGAPSFLAGLGQTLVVVIVNHLLVGTGGIVALAAFSLCARIGTFALMPQLGIAQGTQPIIGYNHGRGLTERAHHARTLALRATVFYGCIVSLVVIVAAEPLAALFTDSTAVRDATVQALRIIALSYPVAGVAALIAGAFQAQGQATPAYLISIGSTLAIRIPLLLVASRFGTFWIWISYPVAELLIAIAALLILRGGKRSRSSSLLTLDT